MAIHSAQIDPFFRASVKRSGAASHILEVACHPPRPIGEIASIARAALAEARVDVTNGAFEGSWSTLADTGSAVSEFVLRLKVQAHVADLAACALAVDHADRNLCKARVALADGTSFGYKPGLPESGEE